MNGLQVNLPDICESEIITQDEENISFRNHTVFTKRFFIPDTHFSSSLIDKYNHKKYLNRGHKEPI